MPRLDYSKWDQLELSDDSDIEEHPNVDTPALIRWQQQKIHEKREKRKEKIASLKAEIACNDVLLPRIQAIHSTLISPPVGRSKVDLFNEMVEKLERDPSPDAPPVPLETGVMTYDAMILSLLRKVAVDAKKEVEDLTEEEDKELKLEDALVSGVSQHVMRLPETQIQLRQDLETEEKEQQKHITSEDLHDGFDNKYVPPKPEPPPVTPVIPKKSKTVKTTKATEIEVLNPKAATASINTHPTSGKLEESVSLPKLAPSLKEFSRFPLRSYENSFQFIQSHRDVFVPGASDALLVQAFKAASNGKTKYAKRCVHQSMILQYCENLGDDGVRVFFNKMTSDDRRAEAVFMYDVESAYNHLCQRVALSSKAPDPKPYEDREHIQLVPENANQSITFNVPDGPPPEDLVLEGEEMEGLEVEDVRKALQFRWDVFDAFPEELKTALKRGELDEVNSVLGGMQIDDAEEVVQGLEMSGIMSFADGDETAK